MMRRVAALLAIALLCGLAIGGQSETRAAPRLPLLLPSGHYATGTPEQQARQFVDEWAAKVTGPASERPDPYWATTEVEEVLPLTPGYARAYRLLGRLLLMQVRYAEAQVAYRHALAIDPRDPQAKEGLAEAQRLSRLVRALPFRAAGSQRIFRLIEVRRRPRPDVLVLVAKVHRLPEDPLLEVHSPEVRHYAFRGDRYQETFRTRRAGPDRTSLELNGADLQVEDLQHTGRPQVIMTTWWQAADYAPTYVDIFETSGATVRHMLHVDSHHPPTWVDLDHDGRPELQTDHFVGTTMVHVGLGTWLDIYRYNGRRYVRANGRCRAFSRDQLQSMLDMNKGYPNDPDVLARIAQAYRDLGQPAKARSYERQAREAARRQEE